MMISMVGTLTPALLVDTMVLFSNRLFVHHRYTIHSLSSLTCVVEASRREVVRGTRHLLYYLLLKLACRFLIIGEPCETETPGNSHPVPYWHAQYTSLMYILITPFIGIDWTLHSIIIPRDTLPRVCNLHYRQFSISDIVVDCQHWLSCCNTSY